MLGKEKEKKADILVQGTVAIAAGIIILASLCLPWLDQGNTIFTLIRVRNPALAAILTLILLAVLTIFGGAIHITGYKIGIQITTIASITAFFITILVIITTIANADNVEGRTLNLLIGPWVAAAGAIFGAISSKLERK